MKGDNEKRQKWPHALVNGNTELAGTYFVDDSPYVQSFSKNRIKKESLMFKKTQTYRHDSGRFRSDGLSAAAVGAVCGISVVVAMLHVAVFYSSTG